MISDKKSLRTALLAKRAAISNEEKKLLDHALCEQLAAHPYFLGADALLCYVPIRGEPDLTPLFSLAISRDIPIYLPRCGENGMRFLLYTGNEGLERDRFGISAPTADAPEVHPTEKTLCILPGLAADKKGTRLGYGGGFYDRFLPRFKGKLLFALYHRMIVDTLPRRAHDVTIPQDCIITEKGVPFDAKMDTRTPEL